jgi:hypothetical protein
MKTQIENKIKKNLKTLLNKKMFVEFLIIEDKFTCQIKTDDEKNVHFSSGEVTEKGLYLKIGYTSSSFRRKGISQSVRESIHSVLKNDFNKVLYTNSKEFINISKTEKNISPLYELWEKLVSQGKVEKINDDYIMI